MNRMTIFRTLVIVLIWCCLQNFNILSVVPKASTNLAFKGTNALGYKIKKVVLDAGHGGKDPGCLGATSKEKSNTLAIVLRVGALIEKHYPGIEVIYTRKTDVFIELNERARLANKNKADVFISVHCNAVGSRSISGTETYVLGMHRAADNLEVAKRENAVITLEENYRVNYGGYDPESPEAHIFNSVYQSAYLEQSILLAGAVQQYCTGICKTIDKGVKQAGFLVLRETSMPSILIETGYLTNRSEDRYLASAEGRQNMAIAIFKAFESYKNQVEGGSPKTAKVFPVKNPSGVEDPVMTSKEGHESQETAGFTIHVLSWHARLDEQVGNLQSVSDLKVVYKDGKYQYFSGTFRTENEARATLAKIRQLGFKSAAVVPID
jgi:N-acetylmuramoyl-L-alanine amidase